MNVPLPGPGVRATDRSLRTGALLILVGLVLALVAWNPPDVYAGTRFTQLSGTLTLSVQSFGAPILKPVLDAFQQQNPHVKIEEAIAPAGGAATAYQTSLLTEKLAHNLPDIVNPQDVLSPTLSTDGITQSLTPYLKKGKPYHQNYWLPNILASYIPTVGKNKGQVFALPNEADAVVIAYNKDEFQAAGVPLPTDNWTWGQMIQDASKLKKFQSGTQTQWGLCTRPDWQAMYNPLMKAFGVTSLSEKSAHLASTGSIKAWKMLVDPTMNGDAVPYSVYLANSTNCTNMFDAGQVAMAPVVRGNLPVMRPGIGSKFSWDVVPMPFVQGVHGPIRPTGAGSIAWAMSSQAKDIPLTLAFFKFLFSPQGQTLEENGYGVVPAIPSALKSGAAWEKLPGPPDNVQAFTIAAKSGTIAPQTPNTVYSLTQTDIPKAIEGVVDNHESYQQAFGQLQSQVSAQYQSGG